MTDLTAKLAEIADRHAKATPGEWSFDGEPHNIIVWSSPDDRVCFMTSNGPAEENASFIVNARTDIPFLLAEVARLRAERAEDAKIMREAAEQFDDLVLKWWKPTLTDDLRTAADKAEGK